MKHQEGYLNLFVYGTLRTGFANHDRYCRGALEITPASVVGHLYDLGHFPALEVPDDIFLVHGTADPAADVATQARFKWDAPQDPNPQAKARTRPGWGLVHGEVMTFDDPESRLPRLDRLEGFCPGDQSLYTRVLVPVMLADNSLPAWIYVASEQLVRLCRRHVPP